MKFAKMHGLGNDYVYVDCFTERISDPAGLARLFSDRHKGIGSDGLILIGAFREGQWHFQDADIQRRWLCCRNVRQWNPVSWEICL